MQTEPSDNDLIQAYLNGDQSAFEMLYCRYRQLLYGYLQNRLPGSPEIDDLFQKTWVKAAGALHRYRCQEKFQAWLFCICRNLVIDHIRHRKRRGDHEVTVETLPDLPGNSDPVQDLSDRELQRKLQEAVAQLSPDLRAVFLMRQNDVSFKVIAAQEDCRVGTAIMRMQYALRKLRQLLSEPEKKNQEKRQKDGEKNGKLCRNPR